MADEVIYARVILKGKEVFGEDSAGQRTLLGTATILPEAIEMADGYAYRSGVTFEVEPI